MSSAAENEMVNHKEKDGQEVVAIGKESNRTK